MTGGLLHHRMRHGTGPAVVLLHALGTDLSLWDGMVRHLPGDVPVLACDLAGHGASPRGAASVEAHADDVALLMEHHGLREAIVCGVSLGGVVAQTLATRRSDLVGRLVLICTGLRIGDARMWHDRREAILMNGPSRMASDIAKRWVAPNWRKANPDGFDDLRRRLGAMDPDAYIDGIGSVRNANLANVAGKMSMPTLCIAGARDLATPPEIVAQLATAWNADLEVIPEVAYLPPIEAPSMIARSILAA